jgi:hypothetical protein
LPTTIPAFKGPATASIEISMAFSEDYGGILLPFVEKYKSAKNEKARKAILKTAADAVSKSRDLLEDDATELPKDLPTVRAFLNYISMALHLSSTKAISRYIKLSIQKETNKEPDNSTLKPKPRKVKKLYCVRDVVKLHHGDLVAKEIGYKTDNPKYLANYQRAVTAVIDNMTEEDLEAAQQIANDWSEQGAPPEVQLK